MKTLRFISCLAGCALAVGGAACTRNPAQSSHWYHFNIAGKGEVAATSQMEPEELAKALADAKFVCFENVLEFNGAGQWKKAKPPFRDTLFVRPQEIKSFEPMDGPPKDFNLQDIK